MVIWDDAPDATGHGGQQAAMLAGLALAGSSGMPPRRDKDPLVNGEEGDENLLYFK
jgi:hypothetical protein